MEAMWEAAQDGQNNEDEPCASSVSAEQIKRDLLR